MPLEVENEAGATLFVLLQSYRKESSSTLLSNYAHEIA
jgi:hypothetical protein